MLLAALLDVLEKLAVPIGIALAVIVILAVPPFRKGILQSFRAGQQAGEKLGKRAGESLKGDKKDPK